MKKILMLIPLLGLMLAGCSLNPTTPSTPSHEHSFGEWTITTPATCVDAGVETRTCECGESETRTIDALGHSMIHVDGVEATYTTEGVVEHDHCERCGKDFDANGVELTTVVIPEVSYSKTIEDVTLDIQTSIGTTYTAFNLSSYAPDGADLTNSQASEELLVVPVSILYSVMPEYLGVYGSHFYTTEEDYWEDESGDTVYSLVLVTPRIEVGVEIIGYVYNGALVGQYSVFDGSLLA